MSAVDTNILGSAYRAAQVQHNLFPIAKDKEAARATSLSFLSLSV